MNWKKYTYLNTDTDTLIEISKVDGSEESLLFTLNDSPHILLSVEDVTINNTTTEEEAPMIATTEYLERQNNTMLELIQKKDELINRLQEEVSVQSNRVSNMRIERGNLINSVKEYVIESLASGEMSDTISEVLADLCDFELTTEVTATVTVTYEIQMQVPVGEDAESMIQDIDFETVSYDSDYINWFNAEIGRISIDS